MCDTLAIKRGGAVWFGKNSDREPEEIQRVEIRGAVANDGTRSVRCTYVEIPEVADRRAVILSRPDWMWGAEMGVNDAGVAIGNEAVFSRSVLKKGAALLGMDLVRLGLERASSAAEAAEIMTMLLERHGQGGPAGFADKKFRYDNSFLIADSNDILVLETAGRDWAVKRAPDAWSISNTYTIRADHDRASPGTTDDFKAAHETFAMPRLASASDRRAATMALIEATPQRMSLSTVAAMLRAHAKGDGFDGGSNKDVCMHASGVLRPHASTASMIVKLTPGQPPRMAFTGTINPCMSLFKPVDFAREGWAVLSQELFEQGAAAAARAAKDRNFRERLRRGIREVESPALEALEAGRLDEADAIAAKWIRDHLGAAAFDVSAAAHPH